MESEHNEVDGMKKGVDSKDEVMLVRSGLVTYQFPFVYHRSNKPNELVRSNLSVSTCHD